MVFVLSRAWDKEKFWVPMRNRALDRRTPRSDALPLSHRDSTMSEVYYEVQMTRVLHTARISNFDSVMFLNRIREMVSFELDKEMLSAFRSPQKFSLCEKPISQCVYSALWVQFSLVLCYLPFIVVEIVIVEANKRTFPSHLLVTRGIAATLLFFNSTLNPFLYCWKISEVRQAVKQTIRQALCCPWS